MTDTLPVFVINLDRRKDRWEAISANLSRIGLTAVRIPAVEASALAARDKFESDSNGAPSFRISYGAAACGMGHAAAMQRLLESGTPAALILEDDAELCSDTAMLLRSVDWWPSDTMVVRLECAYRRPRLVGPPVAETPVAGRSLRRIGEWIGGSAAYLISRDGARIVLQALTDPQETIDRTLFDLRVSPTARRLRPHQIVPPVARQRDDGASDIVPWDRRWSRTRSNRPLGRELAALPHRLHIRCKAAVGRLHRVDLPYEDTAL